ncbi:MAG TPA: hypothetical protein VKY85_21525 [Candidatus Angelobacter sp.]|nr:hypothetical protein [Candidatus Angelobacter sp.]
MLKKLSAGIVLLALMTMTPAVMTAATPANAPNPAAPAAAEPHPHIRAAIRELREARHELETAAHDFGGHKKEAIEAVDNAIKQLQEALKYDKK